MKKTYHQPVMLTEVLEILKPTKNKRFIDATLGHGGHSLALLQKGAQVLGIDLDKKNLSLARERLLAACSGALWHTIFGNFSQIASLAQKKKFTPVDGVFFDLGLSRSQQTGQGRGFSFFDEKSLDMRLDPVSKNPSAQEIVNQASLETLIKIFSQTQERHCEKIAKAIVKQRKKTPIKTAASLAQIIKKAIPPSQATRKIHPATKVFLALRIAVNQELESLKEGLKQALEVIKKGGIVLIISFHSGEDRLVKNFLRQNRSLFSKLPKVLLPTPLEISQNPLSRSARLRWACLK